MSDPQKYTAPADVRSALWARLEGARGRDYWRSLDELSNTPEFKDLVEQRGATGEWRGEVDHGDVRK